MIVIIKKTTPQADDNHRKDRKEVWPNTTCPSRLSQYPLVTQKEAIYAWHDLCAMCLTKPMRDFAVYWVELYAMHSIVTKELKYAKQIAYLFNCCAGYTVVDVKQHGEYAVASLVGWEDTFEKMERTFHECGVERAFLRPLLEAVVGSETDEHVGRAVAKWLLEDLFGAKEARP